jgi:hypothetical protein
MTFVLLNTRKEIMLTLFLASDDTTDRALDDMRDSTLPPRFLVVNSSACILTQKGALQVSFGVSTTLFSMYNVLLVACHGLFVATKAFPQRRFW